MQQYTDRSCLRPAGLHSDKVGGILHALSSAYQSSTTRRILTRTQILHLVGVCPFDKQLNGSHSEITTSLWDWFQRVYM